MPRPTLDAAVELKSVLEQAFSEFKSGNHDRSLAHLKHAASLVTIAKRTKPPELQPATLELKLALQGLGVFAAQALQIAKSVPFGHFDDMLKEGIRLAR